VTDVTRQFLPVLHFRAIFNCPRQLLKCPYYAHCPRVPDPLRTLGFSLNLLPQLSAKHSDRPGWECVHAIGCRGDGDVLILSKGVAILHKGY